MIHRFVTFEVAKKNDKMVREALENYIKQVYHDSDGAMMYHKVTDDEEHAQALRSTYASSDGERHFTVCFVFDPNRSKAYMSQPRRKSSEVKSKMVIMDEKTIGKSETEKLLA